MGYTIHRHREGTETATINMLGQDGCWQQFDTPLANAALLVLPSSTVYPVVDCHEFTGTARQNGACESRLALSLVCLDVKLLILAALCWVFNGKSSHMEKLNNQLGFEIAVG